MDCVKKTCFKCSRELPLQEFYKHKAMADGHLGKCKDCTKRDSSARYEAKREECSRQAKERNNRPEVRAKWADKQRRQRARHPERYQARTKLGNAVRDRRIIKPKICDGCKEEKPLQAHHHDYSKPLDVRWLCFACHRELEHGQTVTDKDFAITPRQAV
jgi:hypothetical protein